MQTDIQITKTKQILIELNFAIKNKSSWSLLRMGDGGLKLIHAFVHNEEKQLLEISKQEGIPLHLFKDILNFWKISANNCNYIDSPAVYFTNEFWDRTRGRKKKMSQQTLLKLKNWKEIYSSIGIENNNYCNPEINFLMCLTKFGSYSLPKIMENKKICCISARNDINKVLSKYDIDVLRIPGKNENQYQYSFLKVVEKITTDSCKYDLWLIAAGELGRIYPGLIKFGGGRALDIGSLIDFWCTKEIPLRLKPYIQSVDNDPLKLTLTKDGREFRKFL